MVRLKQSKLTDDEKFIMKNLASEKLHRQRLLKEHVAVPIIEMYFLFKKMSDPKLTIGNPSLLNSITKNDELNR